MLLKLKAMKPGETLELADTFEARYAFHWARMEMMGKAAFTIEGLMVRKEYDMDNGDLVDNSKFMAGVTSAQKQLRWSAPQTILGGRVRFVNGD